MSEYEKKEDVVTIFGRKQILPALEDDRAIVEDAPEAVIFEFPDGKLLSVSTSEEIIIGRKPREARCYN